MSGIIVTHLCSTMMLLTRVLLTAIEFRLGYQCRGPSRVGLATAWRAWLVIKLRIMLSGLSYDTSENHGRNYGRFAMPSAGSALSIVEFQKSSDRCALE